jgi:hypothetical protein
MDEHGHIVTYLDGLQAKVNALWKLQSASREELSLLTSSPKCSEWDAVHFG